MSKCQDITEKIEQGKLSRISVSNKLAIRFHMRICGKCRSYFKDSNTLDRMLTRKFKHLGKYTFTPEEKEKLKKRLD